MLIPTGSTNYTKVNNIYDMAGNAWEWTMQGYSSKYRSVRGGGMENNSSSVGISYPMNYHDPDARIHGTRAILLIK